MKISPPPGARFAVVIHPGTIFEEIDSYTGSLNEAQVIAADLREPGIEVDAMKVVHSTLSKPAYLTTEF